MTIDLRLLPIAAATWLGCAVGLHTGIGLGLLVLFAIAAITVAVRPATTFVCAVIIVASIVAAFRVAAADPAAVAALVRNAGSVHFTAVVNGEPIRREQRGFGGLAVEPVWQSQVTLIGVVSRGERVHASVPAVMRWHDGDVMPEVGAVVSGEALLHPDDPVARSTYRIAVRGPLVLERETTRGSRWTSNIRNSLAGIVHANAPHARDGAVLLPGLVLGDTRAQPTELVDALRTSGLSHLTAVSGANVAIVLGAVLWLLQRTRLRRRFRFAALFAVLVLFVAVVQPQPSVMRAAIMGAIALYALATGAAKQSASALWLSVVLLLLVDPFMAWQFGFGLSVAATAGLIVLQPWMSERLPSNRWLQALLVTVAAQIATLPLLLLMGKPPTWTSIPANVLAEPLVAPATICGFIATALAAVALLGIPVLSPVLEAVASLVALPGVLVCDVIAFIARRGADSVLAVSPFATVTSTLVFVAVLIILWRLRRHRLLGLLGAGLYVAATACAPTVLHRWPPDDWWFAMCDVGQGDASVLRTGPTDAVVIDAGPDPRAMRTCLRALGVRRIPVFVVTHFHADHVEGAAGVVAQAEVQRVLSTPLHQPLIEYQRTRAAVPVTFADVQRGDRFRVGDAEFEVLWPDPAAMSGEPNNSSLVIRASTPHGVVLLTGDADADAQSRIPAQSADLLKVPHHGSRYQFPAFLGAVRPSLALISVGDGNDYGHPAQSTVGLLRSGGVPVLRTDRVGGIAVVGSGTAMAFAVQRP